MINKKYWDNRFKEWFKLPEQTILFYYRNPSDFNRFNNEMVNPTHKGFIYGYRNKRDSKGNNPVKVGKIYISNIITAFYNEINQLVNLVLPNINISMLLYNMFLALLLLTFILKIPSLEIAINNIRC